MAFRSKIAQRQLGDFEGAIIERLATCGYLYTWAYMLQSHSILVLMEKVYCPFCRHENELSYAHDEDAEENNDASGVVANYLGEFFCPTCRRISNALMPLFSQNATPQETASSPPPRTGKRKLDAGQLPIGCRGIECIFDFHL